MLAVILLQHLAELLGVGIVGLLLRELADPDFRKVGLNGFRDKPLIGFVYLIAGRRSGGGLPGY